MGSYRATVIWKCRAGEDFTRGRYSRAHEWRFDGGVRLLASASPSHVPLPYADPTAVDPEEAFVAALSSCHMLFFLYLAGKRGLDVTAYEDEAVGEMAKAESGREWIARVTLRPMVTFQGERRPSRADLERLHHEAHELCYLRIRSSPKCWWTSHHSRRRPAVMAGSEAVLAKKGTAWISPAVQV